MQLINGSKGIIFNISVIFMGISDWFKNDLNTEERALTRDLLSVAIADHEFS